MHKDFSFMYKYVSPKYNKEENVLKYSAQCKHSCWNILKLICD